MNTRNPRLISLTDIEIHQQITDWVLEHIHEFSDHQLDKMSFLAQSEMIDRSMHADKNI